MITLKTIKLSQLKQKNSKQSGQWTGGSGQFWVFGWKQKGGGEVEGKKKHVFGFSGQ